MPLHTLITSLAGEGKTETAKDYVAHLCANGVDAQLLSADMYRYSDDKWTKAPAATFIARVLAVIAEAGDKAVVLETAFHDAHDPEQAREQLVKLLIDTTDGVQVRVIHPTSLAAHVAQLAVRSWRRAKGLEAQGACEEKQHNVDAMLRKAIVNWGENTAALNAFVAAIWDAEVDLAVLSRDDMRAALGLAPFVAA